MWCVFICNNGAYYKFLDILDSERGLIDDEELLGSRFYAAFRVEGNAQTMVILINSATF